MPDLAQLLSAASILCGATKTAASSKNVGEVLVRRLVEARDTLNNDSTQSTSVGNAERETALLALSILEQLQTILDYDESRLIGSRDLTQLRTLVSIVFKWYIQPGSDALCELMTSKPGQVLGADDLQDLLPGVSRLWSFVFRPDSSPLNSTSPSTSTHAATRTHITQTIVSRHLTDLLRPSLLLISANRQASGESAAVHTIQSNQDRLLELLTVSQTISSIGIVMTPRPGFPRLPSSTRSMCSTIMGEQLLRDDGVSGLLSATFGDVTGEEASLNKLEHVSRLLTTPSRGTDMRRYISIIVPQLLEILAPAPVSGFPHGTDARRSSHRRAAAFTISRMMSRKDISDVATPLLRRVLCKPFLREVSDGDGTTNQNMKPVSQAVLLLSMLIGNADPSPILIHLLLSPIIVPLYALVQYLEERPGAVLHQVSTGELARGLVSTWARVIVPEDVVDGWWRIVTGKGGWGLDDPDSENPSNHWSIDDGELFIVQRGRSDPLSLLDAVRNRNDFGSLLRPDPCRLVFTLKELNKKEISGAFFIRCLNEYSALNDMNSESHPLRSMLMLNVILEMIEKLGSSILENVEHILSFIAHAFEPAATSRPEAQDIGVLRPRPPKLDDLQIIDPDDEGEYDFPAPNRSENGDSGPQDVAFTAVNLLLAVLEDHERLTPVNTPLLEVIFSRLEPLTNHHRDFLRKAALEARLVITTRRAAGINPSAPIDNRARPPDQEVYQEALKLIRDPILPVRAHGLLKLRQLVVRPGPPRPTSVQGSVGSEGPRPTSSEQSDLDPALIPAILDVFLQSVQDDDSYVFLNAVQGLSAMVDRLGRNILTRLMDVYADTSLTSQISTMRTELDKRLRVGEALGRVVRRCGDALPAYVGGIAPQLLQLFRARHVPTNLRSSALSILAACVETSPIALLPWTEELISGMIDVLRLESVPFTSTLTGERDSRLSRIESEAPVPAPSAAVLTTEDGANALNSNSNRHRMEDAIPALTISAKAPTLRRSALHFLSQLLRTFVLQLYDAEDEGVRHSAPISMFTRPLVPSAPGFMNSSRSRRPMSEILDSGIIRTLGIVARYVRDTDVDGIVRAQAAECVELLEQLAEARLRS